MKSATLSSILTAIFFGSGDAILSHKRHNGAPRVVTLDLHRTDSSGPAEHNTKRPRSRKPGSFNATVDNMQTLYFINVTIGTPGQELRMHLDTGSSDLWVNTPASGFCSMSLHPCHTSGTYDANSSSTYKYVGSSFNISYTDGSGASGDYITDNVHVAGTDITNLQFGVGYRSSSAQSILGIGYQLNEVQVLRSGRKPYPNLPTKLVAEGKIASNAFSMWLNDLDASSGSIMFGGIDRARFQGDLISLPIQKAGKEFTEFLITMTGLDVGSVTVGDDMALAVLLDSGSSLTWLPNSLTEPLYARFNAFYDDSIGMAFVPCALREEDTSMTFRFSDPASITVPISELVLDVGNTMGRSLSLPNGDPACLFGIAPAGISTIVLGDTFLRSAYVVFDMENNEISLAQSKFNVSTTDVMEIGTGKDAVPLSSAAPKPVNAAFELPQESHADALTPSVPYLALVVAMGATTAIIAGLS